MGSDGECVGEGTGVEWAELDDCLKAGDEGTEISRMMGKFLVEMTSWTKCPRNKTREGWCFSEPSKETRVSNVAKVQEEGSPLVTSKSRSVVRWSRG